MRADSFVIRAAEPRDIPALMRLKRLLAESENSLHAVRATAADWLRDGFGGDAGFTAFVAESADAGIGNTVIGMATCSRRVVTGWNGPVIFLQDLFVDPAHRQHGVARALMARVAALARDLGSPIVELTVRADNPAQGFYVRSGFTPLPECLTFVLAGPALLALADENEPPRERGDDNKLALAG
jgi:GNAT superfamily N-acetyltransferase